MARFWKKLLKIKWVLWFYSQLLSETFPILRRTERYIINTYRCSRKAPVILAWSQQTLSFLDIFSKYTQISNVIKIHPVGAELFHADGKTESEMTKLIVALRNFVKARKKPAHGLNLLQPPKFSFVNHPFTDGWYTFIHQCNGECAIHPQQAVVPKTRSVSIL